MHLFSQFLVLLPPLFELILEIERDGYCGGRLLNLLHKRCHCGVPELQTCIQRYELFFPVIFSFDKKDLSALSWLTLHPLPFEDPSVAFLCYIEKHAKSVDEFFFSDDLFWSYLLMCVHDKGLYCFIFM